jgi:hypothetical protein
LEEDVVLHHSSGVGIGWGMSGGEAMGLGLRNYLAVSGIEETTRYLEKIEMGLFDEVEYFEFRACREGCIGGPMTVVDTYQAKRTLQKLVRMFGVEKRVKYAYVRKLYKEGWFFNPSRQNLGQEAAAGRSIPQAIRRQEEVDRILRLLPRKECGACGSPDCRTFAGDVVDGRVSLANCVFREGGKGKGGGNEGS